VDRDHAGLREYTGCEKKAAASTVSYLLHNHKRSVIHRQQPRSDVGSSSRTFAGDRRHDPRTYLRWRDRGSGRDHADAARTFVRSVRVSENPSGGFFPGRHHSGPAHSVPACGPEEQAAFLSVSARRFSGVQMGGIDRGRKEGKG